MKCGECKDTGWIEAEGRLGLEIQMCQECFKCKSDEEEAKRMIEDVLQDVLEEREADNDT